MNALLHRPSLLAAVALCAASLLVLPGCPPTDDDDDSSVDDGPVGDPPVITGLSVCKIPVTPAWCTAPGWVAEFRVNATDADCDLDNYWYFILIEGNSPVESPVEGTLGPDGCGGLLRAQLCSDGWVSGADISFQFWLRDDAGNDSDRWEDTWSVPLADEADCEPL